MIDREIAPHVVEWEETGAFPPSPTAQDRRAFGVVGLRLGEGQGGTHDGGQ